MSLCCCFPPGTVAGISQQKSDEGLPMMPLAERGRHRLWSITVVLAVETGTKGFIGSLKSLERMNYPPD